MTKGLDALHHPRIKSAQVDISVEGKLGIGYMSFGDTKQYATIVSELKDYEKIKTTDLKELNDILALHDKWLGNEISDFEFFTLFADIRYKHDLEKEVLAQ